MIKKNEQFIFFLTGSKILFVILMFVLFSRCMKRAIFVPEQEKPMVIEGMMTKEIGITFLNKYYPQYNTDTLPWQYLYIQELENGNSFFKIVWKEDEQLKTFTDIFLLSYNDTVSGVLFQVKPDSNYLVDKRNWIGEGFPTRYYVYDEDFTGTILLKDLKTTDLLLGGIYEKGKLTGYIYPASSSNTKAGISVGSHRVYATELNNVTVYSYSRKSIDFYKEFFESQIVIGGKIGGGGGGGSAGSYSFHDAPQKQVPKESTKTPCDLNRRFANNPKFRDAVDKLVNNRQGKNESIFIYYQNATNNQYEIAEGSGNTTSSSISYPANSKISYQGHSHPPTGNYTFSAKDIFATIWDFNHSRLADPANYTEILITDITAYALLIKDVDAFRTFAAKYKGMSYEKSQNTFFYEYGQFNADSPYPIHTKYEGRDALYNANLQEKSLMLFLQKEQVGLGLLKEDDYYDTKKIKEWTERKINENKEIENIKCP